MTTNSGPKNPFLDPELMKQMSGQFASNWTAMNPERLSELWLKSLSGVAGSDPSAWMQQLSQQWSKLLDPNAAQGAFAQMFNPSAMQQNLAQVFNPASAMQMWQGTVPGFLNPDSFKSMLGGLQVKVAPEKMTTLQAQFSREWLDLMAASTQTDKLSERAQGDRRFSSSEWRESAPFSFTAAAYLLTAKYLSQMAEAVEGTEKTRNQIKFAVQQYIDAMSPSNFLATNPEAQKRMIDSKGESIKQGIENLLGDLAKGRISQSDESAFEVGKNVATTEGAVVYECPLFQLIQYKPTTETVGARPILLVPPCINKFYIMDLQPDNSLVAYTVSQGNTVFLVSWKNVQSDQASTTWDDYIEHGAIHAIQVVREISKQDKINILGFCVGGTIVSTALAVLKARGLDYIESLTLLTTLLDFSDTGILDVFINEAHVQMREQTLGKGGLMPGRDLASAFNSLRPNDLLWNYVVSNYLKGERPPAFDLLYWNADSTNLPGPMYAWYLRNTYLEDNLKKPGACKVAGVPVDLSSIDVPAYVYASREDHIVPWQAAYRSGQVLGGDVKFVLGASGHIAGVINPPAKNKRNYWSNDQLSADPEAWFDASQEVRGSWWPTWSAWLAEHQGKQVKAPKNYGNAKYKALEPAPGQYVKQRA